MLAGVYLTRQQWDLAAENAKAVMDLGVYSLWDDYADNFKVANYNGKESVFEVQFYGRYPGKFPDRDQRAAFHLRFSCRCGDHASHAGSAEIFEEGDYRKDVTFFDSYDYFGHNTFYPHIWKHWDKAAYPPKETGNTGANFQVMRYAQVLLMYAEALNEANGGPTPEAYDAVNKVRERARNGNPDVLPDLRGSARMNSGLP